MNVDIFILCWRHPLNLQVDVADITETWPTNDKPEIFMTMACNPNWQ
jgi:hypothetical protein